MSRARGVSAEMLRSPLKMSESLRSKEPVAISEHKGYTRFGGLFEGMRNVIPANIKETTEAPTGLKLMSGEKIVYNADNGFIMSIRGKDYGVVSHQETVDRTMKIFKDQGIDIANCPTMLNISGMGRVINLRVMLNEMVLTPSDGWPVYGCFEFTNSLNGTTGISGNFKAIRQVCTNGMVTSKNLMQFRAIHSTKELSQTDVAAELAKLASNFSSSAAFYNALIDEKLNWELINKLWQPGDVEEPKSIAEQTLGISVAAGVKSILDTGNYKGYVIPGLLDVKKEKATLYDLYNAVTGMAHGYPDYKKRNTIEESALDIVDAYKAAKTA